MLRSYTLLPRMLAAAAYQLAAIRIIHELRSPFYAKLPLFSLIRIKRRLYNLVVEHDVSIFQELDVGEDQQSRRQSAQWEQFLMVRKAI